MYGLLITIVIATAFGYLFLKLKVPGGMMVGSIIAVATLNIATGVAYMPSFTRVVSQIVAGAFIGASVEKSDLTRLKLIFKPAIVLIMGMMILNVVDGFLIYKLSSLDLMTSLMAAVPGGMSNIPIISAEMGADASKVAVLQFIRLIVGIGIFPTMILKIDEWKSKNEDNEEIHTYKRVKSELYGIQSSIVTITIATFAGLIGNYIGVAAGSIIFSMTSIIILKLSTGKACMPKLMKQLAQILAGAYIGSRIQYKDVLEMKFLVAPAIILIVGYLFACIIIGEILYRKFNIPTKEAMLAATPAGASDMALIASDIGIESADVIVLQIIRMVMAVSVFPQMVNLIVKIIG